MNILGRHKDSSLAQRILAIREFDYTGRFQTLWDSFSGLEDDHFWNEVDNDPDSRIWEMMTAFLLKNEGYSLASADKGPDFIAFRNGSRMMYVEAVAPGPGAPNKPDSVPKIDFSNARASRVPEEQILLRLRGAIRTKMEHHAEHIKNNSANADTPFVIALGGIKLSPRVRGMKPHAGVQILLGVGQYYLTINSTNGAIVDSGFEYRPKIKKTNASAVSMTPFMNEEHSLLSGVLYSASSFWSLDFDPLRDSAFIQNPFAKNPLLASAFKSIDHLWTVASMDRDKWQDDKNRIQIEASAQHILQNIEKTKAN